MPLEEHEIKQLEDRFERMDSKLKNTFQEVERRFDEMKSQPIDMIDHIQELEDLILLMQLEITKLKERGGMNSEFLTPNAPNMQERLDRLEEVLSLKHAPKDDDMPRQGEEMLFQDEEVVESVEVKEYRNSKSLLEEVQKILSS